MIPRLILLALLPALPAPAQEAEDPRLAERRLRKESEVQRAGIDRALSKEMPAELAALPVFGSIKWKLQSIPFVGPGPHEGISGTAMSALDGKIYLAGGFIPGGDETDDPGRRTSRWAHVYDPATTAWTQLPNLPARAEYTRGAVHNGAFLVVGGAVQGRPTTPCDGVFRLDTRLHDPRWQSLPPLPTPRSHVSTAVIGNLLIVAGGNRYDIAEKGYSPKTIQSVVEILDLANPAQGWRQGTPIPGAPRGWCATAALDGKLYLLGGVTWTPEARQRLGECLRYDPAADSWERLADFPLPISGWEADVFAGRYLVAVGGAIRHWNDLAFAYDTREDRWLRLEGPLPPGGLYNDPGVSIIGDRIFVAGSEGPGGSHFEHFLVGTIHPSPAP